MDFKKGDIVFIIAQPPKWCLGAKNKKDTWVRERTRLEFMGNGDHDCCYKVQEVGERTAGYHIPKDYLRKVTKQVVVVKLNG